VSVFKEVSKEKFREIERTVEDFRYSIMRERFSSLDENEVIKQVIDFFERNSTIKDTVGNATIYVIPIYYYQPSPGLYKVFTGHYEALIASLVIEKDSSGYTVKISYWIPESSTTFSREEAEKRIEENIGGFARLLEKALSIKHPNAPRLAELIDCLGGVKTVDFLYRLYGDEILDDDTIPGIHSICSLKTRFFINDKVVVIPSISLWIVRDIRSNKIFRYDYKEKKFYGVPPEKKIFYDALVMGLRDLFEPDAVFVDDRGNYYAFSSFETVVDGRRVALVAYGSYLPESKIWYIIEVLAITCDKSRKDRCSVYSLSGGYLYGNIARVVSRDILWYILSSGRIHGETRGRVAKDIAEKYEWEILPA
jgi:hypothetical protein